MDRTEVRHPLLLFPFSFLLEPTAQPRALVKKLPVALYTRSRSPIRCASWVLAICVVTPDVSETVRTQHAQG